MSKKEPSLSTINKIIKFGDVEIFDFVVGREFIGVWVLVEKYIKECELYYNQISIPLAIVDINNKIYRSSEPYKTESKWGVSSHDSNTYDGLTKNVE